MHQYPLSFNHEHESVITISWSRQMFCAGLSIGQNDHSVIKTKVNMLGHRLNKRLRGNSIVTKVVGNMRLPLGLVPLSLVPLGLVIVICTLAASSAAQTCSVPVAICPYSGRGTLALIRNHQPVDILIDASADLP